MKYLPETSPLTKRFERCPRMAQVDQAGLVAADAPGRFHGNRGVRGRGRPRGEKVGEQRPARRFAQVFGVRPECQSPDGNMASVEVAEAYRLGKKSIPLPFLEHALECVGVEDFERPGLQLLARRHREPLAYLLQQRPETALEKLLQQRAIAFEAAFEAAFFLPLPCPAIYGFRQNGVDLL
jgi:hypothetical protein